MSSDGRQGRWNDWKTTGFKSADETLVFIENEQSFMEITAKFEKNSKEHCTGMSHAGRHRGRMRGKHPSDR